MSANDFITHPFQCVLAQKVDIPPLKKSEVSRGERPFARTEVNPPLTPTVEGK
ncbi:MAG: hypothetical protein SWX82_05680 [Cyanobacteriota bacterium]|nr:hypothetical protein [Cyanobacteriota bacterium]